MMAVIIWPLSRWRLLAAPLTAATLFVLALLCATMTFSQSFYMLGRAVELDLWASQPLSVILAALGILVLATLRLDQEIGYALILVTVAMLLSGLMVRDAGLASILFHAGAIAGVMLVAPREIRASASGLNALVILSLALPLALFSSRLLRIPTSGQIADGDVLIGTISLALAVAVSTSAFPFSNWAPPIIRRGSPVATVLVGGMLGTVVLFRTMFMLRMGSFLGNAALLESMALYAGVALALLMGVAAWSQKSLGGALAYTSLADMGLVLVTIGLGSALQDLAMVHLVNRFIAIVIVSVSLHALRQCSDSDRLEHLVGAAYRAPLAVVATLVGGLGLAGWTPLGGVAGRLSIYRVLMSTYPPQVAVPVIAAGFLSAWPFLKCSLACFRRPDTPNSSRESLSMGLWLLPLVASLLLPGGYAVLARYLPLSWPQFLPFP